MLYYSYTEITWMPNNETYKILFRQISMQQSGFFESQTVQKQSDRIHPDCITDKSAKVSLLARTKLKFQDNVMQNILLF